MSNLLKLTGIYDQNSIQLAIPEGILNFGFDFRPRSLNFIQEYKFKEIIENTFDPRAEYHLHFQDEKDFMVNRIIEETTNSLLDIGREKTNLEKFTLHFSDVQPTSYYKSFSLNFIWEYHPLGDIDKIVACENNVGISLPYNYIQEAIQLGSINEIIAKILKAKSSKGKDFQILLQIDWQSDVLPSLSEFLTPDIIELPVNSYIEKSYRNLDHLKFTHCLKDIKKVTLQDL